MKDSNGIGEKHSKQQRKKEFYPVASFCLPRHIQTASHSAVTLRSVRVLRYVSSYTFQALSLGTLKKPQPTLRAPHSVGSQPQSLLLPHTHHILQEIDQ